jgi:hypothetical protein
MAGRTPATGSRPGREAGTLARIGGAPCGTSMFGRSPRLPLPEWQLTDGPFATIESKDAFSTP